MASVSATVTAENGGTPFLRLPPKDVNRFTCRVRGAFVGTVVVQVKRPGEPNSEVVNIKAYDAPTVEVGEIAGPWDVRAFVQTGSFTSGSIELEVSDDN